MDDEAQDAAAEAQQEDTGENDNSEAQPSMDKESKTFILALSFGDQTEPLVIKVKEKTKWKKIFEKFAEHNGKSVETLKFSWEGALIPAKRPREDGGGWATVKYTFLEGTNRIDPEDLSYEIAIDAHESQSGGCDYNIFKVIK